MSIRKSRDYCEIVALEIGKLLLLSDVPAAQGIGGLRLIEVTSYSL